MTLFVEKWHYLLKSDIFRSKLTSFVECDMTHCNTLQHTATHCNTIQNTATHFTCTRTDSIICCMAPGCVTWCTATHCNTLQHTATHIYTRTPSCATWCIHSDVTYCNTLQHATTHIFTRTLSCMTWLLHKWRDSFIHDTTLSYVTGLIHSFVKSLIFTRWMCSYLVKSCSAFSRVAVQLENELQSLHELQTRFHELQCNSFSSCSAFSRMNEWENALQLVKTHCKRTATRFLIHSFVKTHCNSLMHSFRRKASSLRDGCVTWRTATLYEIWIIQVWQGRVIYEYVTSRKWVSHESLATERCHTCTHRCFTLLKDHLHVTMITFVYVECRLFYRALLQKRTMILRSLLIVATTYLLIGNGSDTESCHTYISHVLCHI